MNESMIQSFANETTADIFRERNTKADWDLHQAMVRAATAS
jgi:hypothetical protein